MVHAYRLVDQGIGIDAGGCRVREVGLRRGRRNGVSGHREEDVVGGCEVLG